MKKQNIIALFLAVALAVVCVGCNSVVPTYPMPEVTKTETPDLEPTTSPTVTTPTITPAPTVSPVDTPFDPDLFKNTYWINSALGIAYFFKDDGNATVFMTETKSEARYSFSEDTLTVDGMEIEYSLKEAQLVLCYFGGINVALDKATEEEFKLFIKETDKNPEPDGTAVSDYVGLTVNEFVKTGAEISGYMGFNGEYEFSAHNEEKNEKYTFWLTGGNVKEALSLKNFDNEYQDVLGDFTISKITVIKLDDAELQKHLGKTVAELEADGFEIKGFMYFGDLTLFSYDDNNTCVEITLDGNVSEVYDGLEDPFDEDMGEVFAQFTIKTIKYSLY